MNRTEALAVEDQAFEDALKAGGVEALSLDNGSHVAIYRDGALVGIRTEGDWAIMLEAYVGVTRSEGGAVADSQGDPPDTREAAEAARKARLEAQKAYYEDRVEVINAHIADRPRVR